MKYSIVLIGASCIALSAGLTGNVCAQSSSQQATTSQQRPDARYPNPSGQDSKPSSTQVNPTSTPPPSKKPQDSSRGAAADQTYQDGKKPDVSGGCSTPTNAASAQSANGQGTKDKSRSADKQKTVCTTSGATGHSAKEPRVAAQDDKAKAGEQPKTDAQSAPPR